MTQGTLSPVIPLAYGTKVRKAYGASALNAVGQGVNGASAFSPRKKSVRTNTQTQTQILTYFVYLFVSKCSHEIWYVIVIRFAALLRLCIVALLLLLLLPFLPFSFLNLLHLLPCLVFLYYGIAASTMVFICLVHFGVNYFWVIMQIPPP